jgi:GNAT superfamily N-acetyltransferase
MDLFKWELFVDKAEATTPPIFYELAEKLEPEHGIRVRHMRRRDLKAEVQRFIEVYHSAWEPNWAFVPLTDAEIENYARELRPVLDENWAMVAEKEDGETVGAALTLPDYNQVLRHLNGRLLPFGWAKALRLRRHIKTVRCFALGVKPEYQHTGVAAGLYIEQYATAARTGQLGGEMGWILETNTPMNRALEGAGARIVKRYRMFEKLFDGDSAAGGE